MRKITQEAVAAFMVGKTFSKSNTLVSCGSIYLHGNEIARRRKDGSVEFSLANWNTPTTRERLNGVLSNCGFMVRTKLGTPYLWNTKTGEKIELKSHFWYDAETGKEVPAHTYL